MKKSLVIIIIVVIVLALVAGLWIFFSAQNNDPTSPDAPKTFNPFGIFGGGDTEPGETPDDPATGFEMPNGEDVSRRPAMFAISSAPVAGATLFATTTGTSTTHLVRYVERETGHVYEYGVETGERTRLSNTTIPRVTEALFGNNGSAVAFRRITDDGETVETFFASILPASTSTPDETRLIGSFLPENILSVAMHPTLPQAFYTMRSDDGVSGYLTSRTGTRAIFSHPLYQWQTRWGKGSSVVLVTAPSRQAPGVAFSLNTTNGALTQSTDSRTALTALPNPATDDLLLGTVSAEGPEVFVYNTARNETTDLLFKTLPEKCVWQTATVVICAIPNNTSRDLPDDWYQGVVSFADTLWSIDVESGTASFLINPFDYESEGVDAIHVYATDNFLTFINKKDGSLWLVDIAKALAPSDQSVTF